MELTLNSLKRCFEGAKSLEQNFVGIVVKFDDSNVPEVIINSSENFDKKLAYYLNAYNDDLTLKANPNIKIAGFTFGQSYAEIQSDLFGGLSGMTFGEALDCLKAGRTVAREGWNGKGMYIFMQEGSTIKKGDARNEHLAKLDSQEIKLNPHIDMKAADGSIVIGWLASQTDMFAEDWRITCD